MEPGSPAPAEPNGLLTPHPRSCIVPRSMQTHEAASKPADGNPIHVCFVCTGNVCRSPMAEGLFAAMVREHLPHAKVSSAGVSAWPGQGASPETLEMLRQEGLDLDGFGSRQLDREILAEASHIFAMTRQHLRVIESRFPEFTDKTYLLTEFAADDRLRDRDVPDPIGLGIGAYRETRDLLKKALPSILAFIKQTT